MRICKKKSGIMKSWLDTPLFLLDDMLMMIEKIQYVLAVMERRRSVLVFFYFFSVRYWMKLVHYVCPMTTAKLIKWPFGAIALPEKNSQFSC